LPTVHISLIYPRSRLLTPRVRALVQYLQNHVRPPIEAVVG
jgi:DNA-binding transcriptional LysR family regulator